MSTQQLQAVKDRVAYRRALVRALLEQSPAPLSTSFNWRKHVQSI